MLWPAAQVRLTHVYISLASLRAHCGESTAARRELNRTTPRPQRTAGQMELSRIQDPTSIPQMTARHSGTDRSESKEAGTKNWNSGGGKWRNERYERKQVSWQMSLPRVLQMCFLKFRIDTVSMWRTLFGSCSLGRLDGSSFPRILLSRRLREDDWHKAVGLNKAWKVKFPTWALQTPTVGRWAQEASSVEHLKNPSPRFT